MWPPDKNSSDPVEPVEISEPTFFTLAQVSQRLDLPEAVVRRIAGHAQIPRRFHQVPENLPKLYLFLPEELVQLDHVTRLINRGLSLAQAWQRVSREEELLEAGTVQALVEKLQRLPRPHVAPKNSTWKPGITPQDFASLQGEQALKAQWARDTFSQYQIQNPSKTSPFTSLMRKLSGLTNNSQSPVFAPVSSVKPSIF